MIYSTSRKFIFVHVPKTAGTTVTCELAKFTTFRDVELGGTEYGEKIQHHYGRRFGLRKHSTAAVIRRSAGAAAWDDFFIFGFVRNPYARSYSLYQFLRKWKDGPNHAVAMALSFDEFIASDLFRNLEIEIAKPQAHWLCSEGKLFPGVDFVGRLEDFEADMDFIISVISRRRANYKVERHENKSADGEAWRDAVVGETKRIVEEVYAADFEIFGY